MVLVTRTIDEIRTDLAALDDASLHIAAMAIDGAGQAAIGRARCDRDEQRLALLDELAGAYRLADTSTPRRDRDSADALVEGDRADVA